MPLDIVSTRELLVKLETLKNLLVQRATGQNADAAEYISLRRALVDSSIKSKLPSFVESCRTLDEFWVFIRPKFGNYDARRRFLQEEFASLLSDLESGAELNRRDSTKLRAAGGTVRMKAREREFYPTIKMKLEDLFRSRWGEKLKELHLEVTADGRFSNTLKARIPTGRDIIFVFLRAAPPDIAGFINLQKNGYSSLELVVAEVKLEELKLEDIYQVHKYADLFDATHVFLISLQQLPEEVKRLSNVVLPLLKLKFGSVTLAMATFGEESQTFVEWFPANPF